MGFDLQALYLKNYLHFQENEILPSKKFHKGYLSNNDEVLPYYKILINWRQLDLKRNRKIL